MAAANEQIGIEFRVSTASAVSETKNLNSAILDSKTAAAGAGAEQKKLGQQVAETKARQTEAAEAVRRAKEAQQEHNLTVQAFGPRSREAAASSRTLAAAQEESKRAATAAAKALGDVAREARIAAEIEGDKLTPATKRAAAQIENMGKEAARAEGELRRLDLSITAAAKAAEKGSKSWSQAFSSFAGNMGANAVSAATDKLRDGVGWVLQTGASYETLRVALETTTGSSTKAASEFERLQKFAAATPFGVAEVTEAFIKLGNRGIEPTDRALTAFGNTASAMGKTLDDYVEAVADAVTGENERLKEFGISAQKNGDTIAYTFRGVTEEVKFNAASIQEYLTRIGETNFAGGMERQSQTLAGMWSTMLDNASALADEFTQGLAPALKEIMEGFGSVDEDGRSFARTLGEDVGEALNKFITVADMVTDTLSGENGTIAQVALLSAGVVALAGPLGLAGYAAWEAGQYIGQMFDDIPPEMRKWMAENGKRDARESKEALSAQQAEIDALSAEMDRVYQNGQKMDELSRRWSAAMVGRGKSQAEIDKAAFGFRQAVRGENRMLGGGFEDDRLKNWEAQTAKLETENEYNTLKADKSLSPSEKKRLSELRKELDIAEPVRGKKGKKPPKDPTKGARDVMDWDSQIDTYAAKLEKEQGAAFAKEAEQRQAAAEKAYEAESSLREAKLAGIDREMELLDAQGEQQTQQIDLLFWSIDMENEAENQRAALQDERIRREEQLAAWQVKNAKNDEQRAKATTRVQEVEHRKQLLATQRALQAEEREQAKKLKLFDTVNGGIQELGGALIGAIEAQAEGEKGAMAKSVGAFAEGIRNKLILVALQETALGVAALAGIATAGLAPPHFAAAGLAAAGAVAAAGVAVGFNSMGDSQAGPSMPSSAGGGGGYSAPRGSSSSSSSSPATDDDGVPTSYNDGSSYAGKMAAANSGAANGNTYNVTVLGATSQQVGVALNKLMRDTDRSLGTASGSGRRGR